MSKTPNKTFNFSKTFYSNYEFPDKDSVENATNKYPFSELIQYLEMKDMYLPHRYDEDFFRLVNVIEHQKVTSYKLMSVELSLTCVQNKKSYLNTCLDKLRTIIRSSDSSQPKAYIGKKDVITIIIETFRNLFIDIIFKNYYLTSDNNRKLYRYYTQDDNIIIKTFKTIIPIDRNKFDIAFKEFQESKLISSDIESGKLYNLFNGIEPTEKLDWKGNKNSLAYFIKKLNKKKNFLQNTSKYSHWDIISEFFSIKGGTVKPNEFKNQHPPKSDTIRTYIGTFVSKISTFNQKKDENSKPDNS